MKNQAIYLRIMQYSYKAIFGIEPRLGFSSLSLPLVIIQNIQDGNDLWKIFEDEKKDT